MSQASPPGPDVRSFKVGPVEENAYLVRADSSSEVGVLFDPGEEPQRLLAEIAALGVRLEAILLTHCHFDHIGAVAPIAKASGARVYCPELELGALADVMRWVPPGFGPFESYEADEALAGGERLRMAGLDIEVLFTPGHTRGHLTYVISRAGAGPEERPLLLSGDVLFRGSVGRVDLPGGNWETLQGTLAGLLERFSDETVVYPGHMEITTLGHERATNPFLADLPAAADAVAVELPVAGARPARGSVAGGG